MSKEDMLREAVKGGTTPIYPSKAAIVDAYKDRYGVKNWTSHAASDMAGTTDKKSVAYKSAIRHFQGSRLEKEPTARSSSQFHTLAEKAGLVTRAVKGDTLTVTVKGTQEGSHGRPRSRTIRVQMTGTQATEFANSPNYRDLYEQYGVDGDMFEDGDYAISVEAVRVE